MGKFTDRLSHAWDAFSGGSQTNETFGGPGPFTETVSFGTRQDTFRSRVSSERTIIASIYNRIAIDTAAVSIRHVRLDEDERFMETISSGLNTCLRVEANLDQAGRMFRQDMVSSMFDKGVIAVVPVRTTSSPLDSGAYDIKDMRVGEIKKWWPHHVRVELYNDRTGRREEITLDKSLVAIIENPFYSIMNEPNSTLQRLIRKLNLLDFVDEQTSSGKLDLIIQLPYVIKSDAKRMQAEQRRQDIEFQLKGSQYGIAYTDGTERITQLNRPVENNLLNQVQVLFTKLYSELGITEEIMNGTADEVAMLNYMNRVIEPILDAIVEEFRRKFLTKTARTQLQDIAYYRDPFRLVPVSQLAEISDKFTRNKIASSNDMRGAIGWRPSKDPSADKLENSNMPQPNPQPPAPSGQVQQETPPIKEGDSQNGIN